MSWYEYQEGRLLWQARAPFYALLMAAMLNADSENARRLRAAFPDTWAELDARYHAPRGLLPGEPEPAEWARERYG